MFDDLERWLRPRSAAALRAAGIKTLAGLTVRAPRRRRWWATIPAVCAYTPQEVRLKFGGLMMRGA